MKTFQLDGQIPLQIEKKCVKIVFYYWVTFEANLTCTTAWKSVLIYQGKNKIKNGSIWI